MKKNIEQRKEDALNKINKNFNDYWFGGEEEKALEAVNRIRQQEQEMDKAFEFLVHELRMREIWSDMGLIFIGDLVEDAGDLASNYLKKVEDSL